LVCDLLARFAQRLCKPEKTSAAFALRESGRRFSTNFSTFLLKTPAAAAPAARLTFETFIARRFPSRAIRLPL
jgi:hypothetical protein